EIVPVNRDAAMPVLGKNLDIFAERSAFLDRDNVGAGNGNVVHAVIAEMEQVAEHFQLDSRNVRRTVFVGFAFTFMLVYDFFEIVPVNRDAAMPVLGKNLDIFAERSAFLDRDNVGAGNGNVVHAVIAEMEQVAEHFQLDSRNVRRTVFVGFAFTFMLVYDFF